MKESWAAEIQNHTIRIEAAPDAIAGYQVCITDQTTGQPIENVHKVLLLLEPTHEVTAIIGLLHPSRDSVTEEAIETGCIEVALSARVESARDSINRGK